MGKPVKCAGSNKPNTPKMTSEDYDSKREYYDEVINKAADDYLNEWGGKDSAETKEAWAAYGEKVDELVAKSVGTYKRSCL